LKLTSIHEIAGGQTDNEGRQDEEAPSVRAKYERGDEDRQQDDADAGESTGNHLRSARLGEL
jgi:hypothetical protein